ncbi:DUF2513 domain-containing protein [Lactococcus lactis]|uniref:DUF2513 domain-containing protein n=1 Tax=Lactococcus lactis TaxID=1358 RepID=UPI00210978F3|nr:DUF2513 domain-containing protein [Lactococcus lactis]MCQ4972205.1 DUF2513 domain-containing protein [Lactococcus lactis]MCQ4998011.1 DUF2513 domain-containing protein [Lactococcus lactis]
MKLNEDCVRAVLLDVEEKYKFGSFLYLKDFEEDSRSSKFSREEIEYTIIRLEEAGFIIVTIEWLSGKPYLISVASLTWQGHEFLDNIRDSKVWRETKEVASKAGSVSLSMLETIASSVIAKSLGLN